MQVIVFGREVMSSNPGGGREKGRLPVKGIVSSKSPLGQTAGLKLTGELWEAEWCMGLSDGFPGPIEVSCLDANSY